MVKDKRLRIKDTSFVFFGTDKIATGVLDVLKACGLVPSIIITQPDRPTGRHAYRQAGKRILTPPPVKTWAMKNDIPILQPEKLHYGFSNNIVMNDCGFGIVVSYGKIIPKKVLDLFPMGVLNVHPSLLPKYRGPTPFQTALLNGDGESGVSIILMDEEVDHGPILVNSKLEIVNSDTYTALAEKLAKLSGEMLVGIIPKWIAGEIKAIPQAHSRATYTRKFTSEDGFIKPETILGNPVPTTWSLGDQVQEVEHAERQVRALNPEPGTWTTLPRSDRARGGG